MSDNRDPIADSSAERNAARQEAAIELGKGIALGLVPFLGQAIDAYDTIESAIALYGAPSGEAKETAKFDFLLALVGWIPGPGDGLKKSLRIVNRDPQRYAPVLFDLLRFVLQECGIATSPEALLDEVFDAGKLRKQIAEIKAGVVNTSGFKALPSTLQTVVINALGMAESNMPALVAVVQKRLTKWKPLQRNSSAAEMPRRRNGHLLPKAKGSQVAAAGDARPALGHANTGTHSSLATQALHTLTNEMTGISGEHIADYICADTFHWGPDWLQHDDGAGGRWRGGPPSATKIGKLSHGGNPRSRHVLYKLTDGANGTGLDAVWRADSHNGGKPYAIVEAKATRDEDAPKFMRKLYNTRNPSITSKLGVNGISDASELLEPLENNNTQAQAKTGGGKTGGKKGGGKVGGSAPTGGLPHSVRDDSGASAPGSTSRKAVLVQMSREWIEVNLAKAVGEALSRSVLIGYHRHLFFSPAYLPSPAAHMLAKLKNLPPEQHAHHNAIHYDEAAVKTAVNKRKASLRKKHGNLPSLKAEL